jgi:hypothetical protein
MYIIKSFIALFVLAGIIYGYVTQVPYFSNTFGIQYLFFRFLFLGVLIGGIVGWFLSKKGETGIERAQIIIASILLCAAIAPLKGIYINHAFADDTPLSKKVIFEKEEALRTSRFGVRKNAIPEPDAYYVHFNMDNTMQRIRSKNPSFKNIEKGTEIELPVKKGILGFDFVEIK